MKSSNKPLATRSLVLCCMLGVGVCANADPFSFTAADTPLNIPSSGTMGEAVSTISVPPGSSPGGIADLNVYVESGDPGDLLRKYHLTAEDIAAAAREAVDAK